MVAFIQMLRAIFFLSARMRVSSIAFRECSAALGRIRTPNVRGDGRIRRIRVSSRCYRRRRRRYSVDILNSSRWGDGAAGSTRARATWSTA